MVWLKNTKVKSHTFSCFIIWITWQGSKPSVKSPSKNWCTHKVNKSKLDLWIGYVKSGLNIFLSSSLVDISGTEVVYNCWEEIVNLVNHLIVGSRSSLSNPLVSSAFMSTSICSRQLKCTQMIVGKNRGNTQVNSEYTIYENWRQHLGFMSCPCSWCIIFRSFVHLMIY